MIGEQWEDEGDIDIVYLIEDYIYGTADTLSETDRQGLTDDIDEWFPIFDAAEKTLRKHEAFFRWATQDLVESEVITDGIAVEEFCKRQPCPPIGEN